MTDSGLIGASGVASNITSISQCTPALCDMKHATIGYVPNLVWNEVYLAIFAFLLVVQVLMIFFYRTWSYTIAMFFGLLLECVGYFGRFQMHFKVFNKDPFLIQIIGLTIAPIFFTAAIYLTLSRVIVHYGVHNSFLSPGTITGTFVTADIISLVAQSIGGGLANTSDKNLSNIGVKVMVGGLAFQSVSMVCFIILVGTFFLRVRKNKIKQRADNWAAGKVDPPVTTVRGYSLFVWAFAVAFFLILVRSGYRVAELAHGFQSKLANEEVPFMIFEGIMMLTATFLMTIFHPGRYVSQEWRKNKKKKKNPVAEHKLSVASGTANHPAFYPTARPPSGNMSQAPGEQQWPMHDVRLQ